MKRYIKTYPPFQPDVRTKVPTTKSTISYSVPSFYFTFINVSVVGSFFDIKQFNENKLKVFLLHRPMYRPIDNVLSVAPRMRAVKTFLRPALSIHSLVIKLFI